MQKMPDLSSFYGSENLYRHGIMQRFVFTDGVKYLADQVGGYWLIDAIAFHQFEPKIVKEEFQVWALYRERNGMTDKAMLDCEDGNGNVVFSKPIEYTDFPLKSLESPNERFKLFCIRNQEAITLMLPTEY